MSGNVFCQKMGDMLFYRLHPIRYPGIRTAAAVGKRPAGSTPGFSTTSITSALSTLHRPIRLIGARHFDPVLLWHSVHGQAPLPERELATDRGARARRATSERRSSSTFLNATSTACAAGSGAAASFNSVTLARP